MTHRIKLFCLLLAAASFSAGCLEVNSDNPVDSNSSSGGGSEWLIPSREVIEAQGRDVIPSIDNPQFTRANNFDFLSDKRRVIGVKVGLM